jgi:hypothetical protein
VLDATVGVRWNPIAGHRKLTPHAIMELTMRNANNSAMICCLSIPDVRDRGA